VCALLSSLPNHFSLHPFLPKKKRSEKFKHLVSKEKRRRRGKNIKKLLSMSSFSDERPSEGGLPKRNPVKAVGIDAEAARRNREELQQQVMERGIGQTRKRCESITFSCGINVVTNFTGPICFHHCW